MKINQVLKTKIIVNLSEIPNIPQGFKLTSAETTFEAFQSGGNAQAVLLVGEIEVSKEKAL